MDKKHVVLLGNTAWSMYNFRGDLIRHLVKSGYQVSVLAPCDDEFSCKIENTGAKFYPIDISAKGTNPITDLFLVINIIKFFKIIKPDFAFFYTIKPNIYGGIAAHICKVPFIAVTTGLGYTFVNNNIISKIARTLYKVSFKNATQVWFLNTDDKNDFLKYKLVSQAKCFILYGEGVDTSRFKLMPQPEKPIFILIARLIWDKGIGEYATAARIIRKEYPDAEFQILGFLNAENPSAIPKKQIDEWESENIIKYLGSTNDVVPFLGSALSVVLPSWYREGIPITLLEAASSGRIVITTDNVGCRETVDDGKTGFLCQMRNAEDLADKIRKVISMSKEERAEMGCQAREKVEKTFSSKLIFDIYTHTLKQFL